MITLASDTNLRDEVVRRLRQRRSENPSLSVLDIGGAANPWLDDLVTTYVDVVKVPTTKEVIAGDILDPALWGSMAGRSWDFAVCTHVLEDIRDPLFVARQMQRVAKAGFIAVPNKHTEVSAVESPEYPGYCHHRWIFTIDGQLLRAMAKLPLLGRWAEDRRSVPEFAWFDRSKARRDYELSFFWEGEFRFEYVNGDYYGPNLEAVVQMYRKELGTGV